MQREGKKYETKETHGSFKCEGEHFGVFHKADCYCKHSNPYQLNEEIQFNLKVNLTDKDIKTTMKSVSVV